MMLLVHHRHFTKQWDTVDLPHAEWKWQTEPTYSLVHWYFSGLQIPPLIPSLSSPLAMIVSHL